MENAPTRTPHAPKLSTALCGSRARCVTFTCNKVIKIAKGRLWIALCTEEDFYDVCQIWSSMTPKESGGGDDYCTAQTLHSVRTM